jgi:hypothetical protein
VSDKGLLRHQIAACYRNAAQAAAIAKSATNPDHKSFHQKLCDRWMLVAKSYQVAFDMYDLVPVRKSH